MERDRESKLCEPTIDLTKTQVQQSDGKDDEEAPETGRELRLRMGPRELVSGEIGY